MKAYILLSLLALTLCESESYLKRHREIADKVNRLKTTWTARPSTEEIAPLLGARLTGGPKLEKKIFSENELNDELPDEYDARKAHPECTSIGEIRDQSKCGSCWAHSAVESMSDRICIHSKGEKQTRVSALDVLSCCRSCGNGCHGGWPSAAFNYWIRHGIPSGGNYGDTKTCKPYFLPPCEDHMHKCHDYQPTPKCKEECIEEYGKEYADDLSYGVKGYSLSGEKQMMKEIYENGPISVVFTVYEDFADYKSGIYQHVTGRSEGGHAVKCIGWGVENGVKYWLLVNSWNERWGENGLFRMLRGVNECGIERGADAGMPKL